MSYRTSAMIGTVIAAGVLGVGATAYAVRRMRRAKCRGRVAALRAVADKPDGLASLLASARRHQDASPGRYAAEAWFVYGCALLDARQPEPATRAFQISCHMHPGLNAAILLAYACLKTRAADMPRFVEIVAETWPEARRVPIPGTAWERDVLAAMDVAPADPPTGLGEVDRLLWRIPLACLREPLRCRASVGGAGAPHDLHPAAR